MADTSLDDFIKQKRAASRSSRGSRRGGGRRGRGGRGRTRTYSSSSVSNLRTSSSLSRTGAGSGFKTSRARRPSSFGSRGGSSSQDIQLGGPMGTSLIVSNLEFGVNDADIHELFSEFGRLRRYGVHYNAQGNSIGTAEVVFTRSSDAMKAIQAYQDVPLDGRPMRLHVAMSSFRITQGETGSTPSRGAGGGLGRRGGRRGRGGRSSRGGGGGSGGRRMPSANELNDELDVYHTKTERIDNMDQN